MIFWRYILNRFISLNTPGMTTTMLSSLSKKLSHINTDKIDYDDFYTFTYGKDWNNLICTNIDNDEVLRILFVCHIIHYEDFSSLKISELWKKASQYVIKHFPYTDLKELYIGMGTSLGISKSKAEKYYTESENYENYDEILDMFYKWVYNDNKSTSGGVTDKVAIDKTSELRVYKLKDDEEPPNSVKPPAVKPSKKAVKPVVIDANKSDDDKETPPKPAKKVVKPVVVDVDKSDDSEKTPLKPVKKAVKPVVVSVDNSDDSEKTPPKPVKPPAIKPVKKAVKPVVVDVDKSDDEEEQPPYKPVKPLLTKPPVKQAKK